MIFSVYINTVKISKTYRTVHGKVIRMSTSKKWAGGVYMQANLQITAYVNDACAQYSTVYYILEICGAFITGSRRCQLSQPSPGSQRPLVGLQHILRVYVCCGCDYVCCGQVTEEAGVSMPLITGRGSTFGGCY